MKRYITDQNYDKYSTGVHPKITGIFFGRQNDDTFFDNNRFPNLKYIQYVAISQQYFELIINCHTVIEIKFFKCNIPHLKLFCPFLEELNCYGNQIKKLELNCPKLSVLNCSDNWLTELQLNLNFLRILDCSFNLLTKLELNCPSIITIECRNNQLNDLNGLEFCDKMIILSCSDNLVKSAEILKHFLPNLHVFH
jgi:Leucine-rich repeat (LRR) protein